MQRADDGTLEPFDERSIGTRLGAGVRERGRLSPDAVARTLAVIDDYARAVRAAGATSAGIATSSLRRADDAAAFVREVESRIDAPLEILSGEREAALSFAGATATHAASGERVGVLDVGGGSADYGCGTTALELTRSCEIGAVRLSEALPALLGTERPRDPAALERDARAYASARLASLRDVPPVARVYAVGGTVFNAAMILENAERDALDGSVLTREDLTLLARRFLELDTAGRCAQPRISVQRADIFPGGLLVVDEALACLGVERCTLSKADLLFGYLIERYGKSRAPARESNRRHDPG